MKNENRILEEISLSLKKIDFMISGIETAIDKKDIENIKITMGYLMSELYKRDRFVNQYYEITKVDLDFGMRERVHKLRSRVEVLYGPI